MKRIAVGKVRNWLSPKGTSSRIYESFSFIVVVVVVTFKLSYKTGANIMQIGALFASRQPISSNPGAVL